MIPDRSTNLFLLATTITIVGCSQSVDRAASTDASSSTEPVATQRAVRPDVFGITHKLVYVPTYSHIYVQNREREFDLAATLSIRNSDPDNPITVSEVTYFDSGGNEVRSYLKTPIELAPLASQAYFIEESDRTGGVGANFLVEWRSERPVSEPVIEAVMISTASSQGISFVSRGVVVRPIRAE